MSLACLVCHSMDSPSRSFRSYSVSSSSSEEEGRCAAVVACLARKVTTLSATRDAISTSKVAPFPMITGGQGMAGAPRLLRSRAVTRDLVRDWNFGQGHAEG